MRFDLATVHDDDPIIRSDLVDEMGCPQYRDAVSRRQFVHVIDNALAGGNVLIAQVLGAPGLFSII